MIAGEVFLESKAVLIIPVYSVDYRFTSLSLGESSAKTVQNHKIGNRIRVIGQKELVANPNNSEIQMNYAALLRPPHLPM